MRVLQRAGVDFLVGGAYALREYTGVVRDTKDFDIFMRQRDLKRALEALGASGYRTGIPFPHWLAKVYEGEVFMDIVFRGGNGLCEVDARWFNRRREAELMGVEVGLVAPEFMIWQKAYIMERERYDGADVAHLFLNCAADMDWPLLLELFGPDWRVLLAHFVLFGFIYPDHRDRIPARVVEELAGRMGRETVQAPRKEFEEGRSPLCRGTLISRQQYLPDVERWGFEDARMGDRSRMTPEDIREWTAAIQQHE